MIYVDASVVLASLFGEAKRPNDLFWSGPRLASRLTDLEVRVRAAARPAAVKPEVALHEVMSKVRFVEITMRTVELLYTNPPKTLRTLDAIHLATLAHLNRGPRNIPLATYDQRLATAAVSLGFTVITP